MVEKAGCPLLLLCPIKPLRRVGCCRIQKKHRTGSRRVGEDGEPAYQISGSIYDHRIGGINRVQFQVESVRGHNQIGQTGIEHHLLHRQSCIVGDIPIAVAGHQRISARLVQLHVGQGQRTVGGSGNVCVTTLPLVGERALARSFLPPTLNLPLWQIFFMGAFFGGLGQLGDLSESLIKRDCGVKDSGKFLPGMGGVLDIIDSLLFSAPAFYLYMSSTLNTLQ